MTSPMREQRKRTLCRLVLARADIEATLRICDLADRIGIAQGDDFYFALHYAIVASYARPFSGNDLGDLKGRWCKFGEPRLDEAHKHLVEVRNKYVAHSDASSRPVTIHTPGARLDDGTLATSYGVQALNVALTVESYKVVRELCLSLQERLTGAINDEIPRLFPHYVAAPFRLTWTTSE